MGRDHRTDAPPPDPSGRLNTRRGAPRPIDLWSDLASFGAIPKRSLLNFRQLVYHPGVGHAIDRSVELALAEQVRGGAFKRALTATGMDQGNRLQYRLPMPGNRALIATCVGRSKGEPSSTDLEIDGSAAGRVVRTRTEYSFLHPSGEQVGSARFDGFTLHDAAGTVIGSWQGYAKDVTVGEIVDDLLDPEQVGRSDVLSFGAMRADVELDTPVQPELRTLLVALPIAICFGYR